MSPVTTQLWETSAKGTSQKLCLWRTFSCGTLCGDIKWRVAIASQLVTREDQLQRVRAVQNKGPSTRQFGMPGGTETDKDPGSIPFQHCTLSLHPAWGRD